LRIRFILSEMAIGLRRNLSMSIAVVLTVAISLTGLGAAWLTHKQINTMKDFWFDKIEVSVFLEDGVTQPERDAVRAELDHLPQVEQIFYESKEDAYKHAQELFANQDAIRDIITKENLPESYRVKLYDPERYEIVASAVSGLPGVDHVLGKSEQLERFFRVLNGLQWVVGLVAMAALAATILLIFNTVRLSAYSRRRETGIMRLVGASDLYIQAPFVLEGALAGLVGAGLGALGCVAFKILIIDHGVHAIFGNIVQYIGWGTVAWTIPWVLLIGVVLAGLTSLITLQRYLRV
jgi:cell division transport system permease protein